MARIPRSSSTPYGGAGDGEGHGPDQVLEFAAQVVDYVRRSLGVTLEYDSETLPVLDHYLRQVGHPSSAGGKSNGTPALAADLVAATSGAYFGEVVRRRLGGSWHLPSSDPGSWRMVLPSGLWFFPTAMAMAAILGPDGDPIELDARDPDDDDEDEVEQEPGPVHEWDASLQAPPLLRAHVERVLHGMADVSEDEYYSLCCRLDTLEHVQSVLAAMTSARRSQPDPDTLD
jgi:hypothetical protein